MSQMAFREPFYTVAEVSKALKLSPRTIRRKVRRGELPPLHPVMRRFRGDQLQSVCEAGKPWCKLEKTRRKEHAKSES
ncbi:MAG TPA: helix-turn-helix domain-containing protein [Planctomycetota bacterium]|jgi:excisionase family DNA binding protein